MQGGGLGLPRRRTGQYVGEQGPTAQRSQMGLFHSPLDLGKAVCYRCETALLTQETTSDEGPKDLYSQCQSRAGEKSR